jgi:glucose/arabinose dehydrogenase
MQHKLEGMNTLVTEGSRGIGAAIVRLGGYNNHWTRNILASRDGRKLYVSVGSASNIAPRVKGPVPPAGGLVRMSPRCLSNLCC